MADQYEHLDLKRYLPHAILTTLAVILIPILMVVGVIAIADPNPPVFFTAAIAVVFGMLTVAVGSAWWLRRPESSEISFGDLMIWGWWRRKRAEDQLAEGTRLLGLDRSGRPKMPQVVSREQQVHILRELTSALESKDPYTHGHSRRVERHVYRTAMVMGLASQDIEDLRKAAALHDVGKIRVPDRILRKPEELTEEERAVLEDHVVVGAWMVSSAGNADVVSAVRHHHEQWDGTGYPDGLSTTDIPLFSRIIAVADTYDAITSTRPYRAGAGRERAVEVLQAEAGRQFDPAVVGAFIDTLPAPVPAATGLLALITGPRALGARMAVMLKRVGAGALAPAAGATGAAILVGASSLAPGAIAHDRARNPIRVASGTVSAAPGGIPRARSSPGRQTSTHQSRQPVSTDRPAGSARGPTTSLTQGISPVGPLQYPSAVPTPVPTTSTGVTIQLDGVALSPESVLATVGTEQSIAAAATYEGQAVPGVTLLWSISGVSNMGADCTTDSSGRCSFAYTGPDVPGTDTVRVCGDTNFNRTPDPDEPCGEATVGWIAPVSSVKATGSGEIANAAGLAKITFAFDVKSNERGAKGSCQIVDATAGVDLTIQCIGVSSVERSGNHVTFTGDASIGGVAGTYGIYVEDNGTPGKGRDRFQIQTSTGYSASGVLVAGNIRVHN
jgi:HD superfamily phosphohydrolase YqeK